jgi:hypothetical protein
MTVILLTTNCVILTDLVYNFHQERYSWQEHIQREIDREKQHRDLLEEIRRKQLREALQQVP